MALLKIKDQKEFQDKVGMMCTTHAEEMAQRIMKEKVLLKRTSKGQEEREEAHDGQDDCRDFTEIACKF